MPLGTELVFELTPDDLYALLPKDLAEQIRAVEQGDPLEWSERLVHAAQNEVGDQIRAAHLDLVRRQFDPNATEVQGDIVADIVADTPAGRREFAPLLIDQHCDEDEPVGVLGISILGRYQPHWVDWRDEYGGSGDPIRFTPELLEMTEEARTALTPIVPALATAPLVVAVRHY